jgi:hypothetical protein
LHRLTASFVLGYHGCDTVVAERLLAGDPFEKSQNNYDWLGWGIYFWEANPKRGLNFATEAMKRPGSKIANPTVIGAVIDLGNCLDLMTAVGIDMVRAAFESLSETLQAAGQNLPRNRDRLRRRLDCAVIEHLHAIYEDQGGFIDAVRAVFSEGSPVYPDAGFDSKTHIQIAVRNPECIKGVFRVPEGHLSPD